MHIKLVTTRMRPATFCPIILLLALALCFFLLVSPLMVSAKQVIKIPDAGLRASIENALNKSAGDTITAADLQTLTELTASDTSISDLTGLEAATNLTYLKVSDNQISDISPLSGLTRLQALDLDNNRIWDLSPLSSLTQLVFLRIDGNQIWDLSPLASLSNLRFVHNRAQFAYIPDKNLRRHVENALNKAEGADIGGWEMTSLTVLDIQGAKIRKLTGLQWATNLGVLNLKRNQVVDISPLSGLTNLIDLRLGFNNISDISALSGLTSLSHLRLAFNSISDISALSGLTNLQTLELQGNELSDLSSLSGLTNLQTLGLDNNRISNLSSLSSLTNLQTLRLDNNQISDVSPLAVLTKLRILKLANNQISDFSPLASLIPNLDIFNKVGQQVDADNAAKAPTVVEDAASPKTTGLLANYPNPFNPETWIPYQLSNAADVQIVIYDVQGRLVRRLSLGYQLAGYYTDRTEAAYWDGHNDLGDPVGSGVYFYQLQAGDYSATRRLVILK